MLRADLDRCVEAWRAIQPTLLRRADGWKAVAESTGDQLDMEVDTAELADRLASVAAPLLFKIGLHAKPLFPGFDLVEDGVARLDELFALELEWYGTGGFEAAELVRTTSREQTAEGRGWQWRLWSDGTWLEPLTRAMLYGEHKHPLEGRRGLDLSPLQPRDPYRYISPFAWATLRKADLIALGIDSDAVEKLRRSASGHARPLSPLKSLGVGSWGRVATRKQLEAIFGETTNIKSYAQAWRLRYGGNQGRRTQARVAYEVMHLLDQEGQSYDEVRLDLGLLPVEVRLYEAAGWRLRRILGRAWPSVEPPDRGTFMEAWSDLGFRVRAPQEVFDDVQ